MKDILIYEIGFIISENIPESEILIRYNIGEENTKYYKYFSITNEDTEE